LPRRRCRRWRRRSSSSRWTPAGCRAASSELAKAPADANGWLGPYAKDAELSDPWKQPYTYKVPGESKPFDLVSLGADRQVGGDSVNADIKYQ
jgi:general secretion pathway protein G